MIRTSFKFGPFSDLFLEEVITIETIDFDFFADPEM
tara:strand:- start:251 stop:358 length:108 start_codon:yes stop_codon:yes gene_type:complete